MEISTKIIRRLAAAEGYLELDMPDYALSELDGLDAPGPYEAIAKLLMGEAYKAQERYREAIEPLQRAAQLFPAPFSTRAWLALSECYRHRGQTTLADAAQQAARHSGNVQTLQKPQGGTLVLKIVLEFRPQQADQPENAD